MSGEALLELLLPAVEFRGHHWTSWATVALPPRPLDRGDPSVAGPGGAAAGGALLTPQTRPPRGAPAETASH